MQKLMVTKLAASAAAALALAGGITVANNLVTGGNVASAETISCQSWYALAAHDAAPEITASVTKVAGNTNDVTLTASADGYQIGAATMPIANNAAGQFTFAFGCADITVNLDVKGNTQVRSLELADWNLTVAAPTVTPGAFCAKASAGEYGQSVAGKWYVCQASATNPTATPHWLAS